MTPPLPADPHPVAHALLQPLMTAWARVPVYLFVALVAVVVFWVIPHLDFLGPNKETRDLQAFQNVLRGHKAYEAQREQDLRAQGVHAAAQAKAERAAATAFAAAESAQKRADDAAQAVAAAGTAKDTIKAQADEIVALRTVNGSLTSGAVQQEAALVQSGLVIMDLTDRALLAEKRVHDLETTGGALARDVSCTLAHLCIPNVHIGGGAGYGLTEVGGHVYAGKQLTLAVVWSP